MMNARDDEKGIGLEVFYTDSIGIGGKLRKTAEDFIVDEISLPPAKDEEGEYTIVRLKAKNWETNRLIRQMSKRLGISRKRIGFAGTKDRRAVTTQLISFKMPLENVKQLSFKDLDILDSYSSKKGLSLGELIGNRFDIVIRDFECSDSKAKELVAEIQEKLTALGGFPNFFGHQRFGAVRPITHMAGRKIIEDDFEGAVLTYLGNPTELEGEEAFKARKAVEDGISHSEALRIFPKHLNFEVAMLNHLVKNENDYIGAIAILPKNLSMMFVHAFQSYLFNRLLSQRIRKGLLSKEPLIGDIILPANKQGLPDIKNEILVTKDNIDKIKKRIKERKAFVTGLVPGVYGNFAEGEQGEIEMRILEEEKVSMDDFVVPKMRELSSKGRRRALVAPLNDSRYEVEKSQVKLHFELTKGCYATSFLREIMKTDMLNY
ncbi:MAG: tRNA pseudouridine(13) synthase TruD [Thermoplasmata archaeon]|nr:MAG: tRNA pseudouridine(13) synthase TruD [Thermoplasmata archaeon]